MCYEFDVISHHKYHVQSMNSFTVPHPVSTLSPLVNTQIHTITISEHTHTHHHHQ